MGCETGGFGTENWGDLPKGSRLWNRSGTEWEPNGTDLGAKVAEFGQRTLHMLDGKVVSKGKIEGLKETETMKKIRMSEAEANQSRCETKIFQYLFSNQGQSEFKLSTIRSAIPKPILDNIPVHFDDIVINMIKDEKIPGKIEGQTLILA